MMIEPIRISLDDYVLTGGGFNGESYDHKTDPDVMLKLYFPGKIRQPLDEMLMARKVYDLGIPSPEPGDYVVTEDGRYGIRFRRIPGKVSYARATGDHPEKVGQYAAEIRSKRGPEPYKGKGIKYADETIRRKVGKAGKK